MIENENTFGNQNHVNGADLGQTISGDAPTLISLFAGTGGSSEGYRMAGLKELLAIELDKHARDCFELNFPEVPIESWNINMLTGSVILNRIGLKPGQLDVLMPVLHAKGFLEPMSKLKLMM